MVWYEFPVRSKPVPKRSLISCEVMWWLRLHWYIIRVFFAPLFAICSISAIISNWFLLILSRPSAAYAGTRPCVFHVKPFVRNRHVLLPGPVFRVACFAVDWSAFSGFKGHCSGFATISTFGVKHSFLGHVTSPHILA